MAGEGQVNFSSQIYLSWFFICAFLVHLKVVCTYATRLIDVWLVHLRHLKSSKGVRVIAMSSVRGHECMTRLTLSPAFSEKRLTNSSHLMSTMN